MTAAIGVAVGLGSLGLALLGAVLTLMILAVLGPVESWMTGSEQSQSRNRSDN
jgi:uncharacterized membrane protein YhiD involved in acid resistance